MNPYSGLDGFSTLILFFQRMFLWAFGSLQIEQLASDEIQMLSLSAVAVSCACVGAFLVLKRMTMLANSLSHTILPGLVVAYWICKFYTDQIGFSVSDMSILTLVLASVATALLTIGMIWVLKHGFNLHEDASISLVSTMMVAIGIVFVTVLTRSAHLGIEAVMGNVDALHRNDLIHISQILVFDLLAIFPFFHRWKIISFDPQFAKTQGVSEGLWSAVLLFITALTVVGAFRAVGILLVLVFLVGPVLTARLFTSRLLSMVLLACGIGVFLSLLGVAVSRHFLSMYEVPLSTAGIVSTLIGLTYLLSRSLLFFCTKNSKGVHAGSLGDS